MAAIGATPTWENLPRYHEPAESTADLDWAELVTLDLSQFEVPGGKQKLAIQLQDAIHRIGFFYVKNFGLTQEEVDRQYAIGTALFALPMEEKKEFLANLDQGEYIGYKPAGHRDVIPGIGENTEVYNVPKFIPSTEKSHPSILTTHIAEIERFSRHVHFQIVNKLLALFAIIMEVPEDHFINQHRYEEKSSCYLRYMKYHAYTREQNDALNNIWLRGHSDFGSLTLLFRQPIAALQVRLPDGTWKHVKPVKEAITVNVADTLEFLSNKFLKSSIHRVITPPDDVAFNDRLGVIYFVRPEDSLKLEPVKSPLLDRMGLSTPSDIPEGITASEWVVARVKKNIDKVVPEKKGLDTVGGVKTEYVYN